MMVTYWTHGSYLARAERKDARNFIIDLIKRRPRSALHSANFLPKKRFLNTAGTRVILNQQNSTDKCVFVCVSGDDSECIRGGQLH